MAKMALSHAQHTSFATPPLFSSYPHTANKAVIRDLTSWTFQEKSVLRVGGTSHERIKAHPNDVREDYEEGLEEGAGKMYRVKDDIVSFYPRRLRCGVQASRHRIMDGKGKRLLGVEVRNWNRAQGSFDTDTLSITHLCPATALHDRPCRAHSLRLASGAP